MSRLRGSHPASLGPPRLLPRLGGGHHPTRHLAAIAQKSTWQTLPSAYIFISAAQRSLFSSLDLPAERCFVKHNLVYPMEAERRPSRLIVYIGRLNEAKGLPF